MSYPFKLEPFAHQREALNLSWNKDNFALLMDMGTGKTKVLLDTAGIAFQQGWINGLLVIAPKGVYRNWDIKEIPKHLPDEIQRRIAYWRATPNKREKAALNLISKPAEGFLDILLMNVDAINTKKGFEVAKHFLKTHSCLFTLDESTKFKTPSAQRTKAVLKLGPLARLRRILTGSPLTRSPEDLYTQFKFLTPTILGFDNFTTYKARYCVLKDVRIPGKKPFKQVTGFQNLDELKEKIAKHSYRIMLQDVTDMELPTYDYYDVELTDEQKRLYNQMLEEARAEFEDKEVTATIVLTKILRLHQLICGHLSFDDGSVTLIKNKRVDALLDILSECQSKAVIWATYRPDMEAIENALLKTYGQDAYGTYHGGTSDKERPKNLAAFEDPDSPMRFLVSNPATGGMGLDMLQGRLNVFYSNANRLEDRIQAEKRSWRTGQTGHVHYIDIRCPGTVDDRIIQRMKEKKELADHITGDELREWLS